MRFLLCAAANLSTTACGARWTRNRFGYRLGRITDKPTQYPAGPIALGSNDLAGILNAHAAGARHASKCGEGSLVFRQVDASRYAPA